MASASSSLQSLSTQSWIEKAKLWDDCIGDHGDETRELIMNDWICNNVVDACFPLPPNNANPEDCDKRLLDTAGNDSSSSKRIKIADLGCGNGFLSVKLAQLFRDKQVTVCGMDVSPESVELAANRAARLLLHAAEDDDACTFHCGDIASRDDGDDLVAVLGDDFDVVVSNLVLMDVADLDAAVRNMARILRGAPNKKNGIGGMALVTITHPVFISGMAKMRPKDRTKWGNDVDVFAIEMESGTAIQSAKNVVTGENERGTPHKNFVLQPKFPYLHDVVIEEIWTHARGEFGNSSPFVQFHRPISTYFATFRKHGFEVDRLEEPIYDQKKFLDKFQNLTAADFQKRTFIPDFMAFRLKLTV